MWNDGRATRAASPSKVRSLGYLGLTGSDLDAWRRFATDVCGMQISPDSTDERLLLRLDERAWRISVIPGAGEVDCIGWEVAGEAELNELAEELEAAGIPVDDPGTAEERQVAGVIRAKDPAGNQVEFFYGAKVEVAPFVSPRGVSFVTGEQGLGHVVLAVPDLARSVGFYIDTLGFRVSDRVRLGPAYALFTHVNPRHHSLALLPARGPAGLHHFMLETGDLDSVGHALDRVLAGAAPLKATLGKHSNDHVISFYCQTPSNCEAEYGWNGRQVDDGIWTTSLYDEGSVWGHRRDHF